MLALRQSSDVGLMLGNVSFEQLTLLAQLMKSKIALSIMWLR